MRFKKKNAQFAFRIYAQKIIKLVIIPIFLFIAWLSLSLLYSSYRSFTVLQYAHNQNSDNNFGDNKLLKNEKITGIFKARENHLGIISIRFGKIPKVEYEEEDTLLFRIKERGASKWIYENNYKSGSFISNNYYPFGFIEIADSKGKVYEFEVISLNGNEHNSVQTKNKNPIYISKYKFTKMELFGNINLTVNFIEKKLTTFFSDYNALFSSVVFLLPLIFYLMWITFLEKIVKNDKITRKKLFAISVLVLIVLEVLFYEIFVSGIMIAFLCLLILTIYLNKYKSAITFGFASLLVCISVFSIYLGFEISIDKVSTYVYFLLIIGFLQSVIEYKKSN